MSQMIESMEPRMLLTGSVMAIETDIANLKIAGVDAKADLKAAIITSVADLKTIKLDVAATHPTMTQKEALATAKLHVSAAATHYKGVITKILAQGFADGTRLDSLLGAYKKHPTSITIAAKVQVALGKLQGVFSTTVISTLESDAAATVTSLDPDLNAVSTAVPSVGTDVSNTETHLNTDLTTLSTDASAIQGAISQLATDLA